MTEKTSLAEWRVEQGWTQQQLAEKLNVATRTVIRWENGDSLPDAFNRPLLQELGFPPKQDRIPEQPAVAPQSLEHPSTYFVEDRSNQEEITRLTVLDAILTKDMGGLLPEQPDPHFKRVLDVGCGTGGWLIELARTIPDCQLLIGVDVSHTAIEYARARASAAGLGDRIEFRIGDALRMLEFPANSFDLVNHRAAASWLRTWDWPKLLREYLRVTCPGGIVRTTELDWFQTTSPAFEQYSILFLQALNQSGHLFTPTGDGVTRELARLLSQYGLLQVQTRDCTLEYRPDTEGWQSFLGNTDINFRISLPFLHKWTQVSDDEYHSLCKRALSEIQQSDFVARCNVLTAWGVKPSERGKQVLQTS